MSSHPDSHTARVDRHEQRRLHEIEVRSPDASGSQCDLSRDKLTGDRKIAELRGHQGRRLFSELDLQLQQH